MALQMVYTVTPAQPKITPPSCAAVMAPVNEGGLTQREGRPSILANSAPAREGVYWGVGEELVREGVRC